MPNRGSQILDEIAKNERLKKESEKAKQPQPTDQKNSSDLTNMFIGMAIIIALTFLFLLLINLFI